MADDLEVLQDGLNSPFFELFCKQAQREWGPSGLRFQQAVRAAAQSQEAVIELQKVIAQQEAVLALIQWPAEQVGMLKQRLKDAAHASTSRRGPGM